jgi:hypothetical protein
VIERLADGNPIRFFQELYAVVVGVGFALAAEQIVDLDKAGVPIRWQHVPLFIAWIAVAVPFAHVFVRYLDVAYTMRVAGQPVGRALAVGNIVFGAGHYLWIIALALFVTRPFVFGYGLVIFLAGVLARDLFLRMHPRGWLSKVEARVSMVFFLAMVGWLAVMVVAQLGFEGSSGDWVARGGVLAVSLTFSFGVYLRAFELFFGPSDGRRAVSG